MSKQIRRDDAVGFSLSFLDLLSCGLGAAILLLLVVKHGSTDVPINTEAYVASQAERLQNELDERLQEKSGLEEQLAAAVEEIESAAANKTALATAQDDVLADLRRQLANLSDARDRLQSASDELQALQAIPVEEPEPKTGPTGHLGGLYVADSQVVVLLDRSASMLDRSLVEIIRLRLTSKQTRQKVEKWSTARKAAEWAFNRVKDQQTFQLLTFSDTVLDINGNVVAPSRQLSWLTKGAAGSELKNVRTMLDSVDANGPTNLERAFEAIATLRPSPKQVLLITDGLPTVPENVSLGRIRGCPNARTGQVPILSPQCRKNIFERSVQTFRSKLRDTSISVVLLPLDGDAQAMYSYWGLTARSRGRVLTPAEGWPW
ncbi:MAG: hypothetical protein F4X44_03670 [Gammaproteobacteria bacterium]|nr:hypothetical protein [Gammaproteobacteria bacterium]